MFSSLPSSYDLSTYSCSTPVDLDCSSLLYDDQTCSPRLPPFQCILSYLILRPAQDSKRFLPDLREDLIHRLPAIPGS